MVARRTLFCAFIGLVCLVQKSDAAFEIIEIDYLNEQNQNLSPIQIMIFGK